MTDGELANELQQISAELKAILADEKAASDKLDRRFDEEPGAIEKLLQSVQQAKLDGRWRNTRFNVFDVLGVARRERSHSSFLAWVLDPAEAHGFGDAFLREFMRRSVGKELPSTCEVSVSLEKHQCGGEIIFDIHVNGDRWCLVVENKVDDSPWDDQCDRYQEYCEKLRGRGEQAWLVYVTPARRPYKAIPWLSYREVRLILETLTPDVSAETLIQQFCEHSISDLEP